MRHLLLLSVFCLLVLVSGCGDDFMDHPAMTAKVNGRDFTACTNLEGKIPTPTLPKNNLEVLYDATSGQLVIKGTDSCQDSIKTIHLDIREVFAPGSYPIRHQSKLYYNLDNTPGNGAGSNAALQFLGRHPQNSAGLFSTQPNTHTGTFTLTAFDLEKRRFSADFDLQVYDARANKAYHITQGRLRDVSF
ncbi:hypothetical protein ACD591_19415 [Rufibacter glacialis]|uniref:Uncharacterized protein n=1 Tax=Rufibacter glacialis TaxID=1259555 RepID=A0A5M8Q578_9BACT|nr:hypothetical protein [Rufibacter glacialis]KAA6430238.1 hypothetical protein FOE74_20700 [Rufibacter glacialis]GGK87621.1 hypothetical protein GCM10011405_39150 [Rufibacter glacialis]